MAIIKFNETGTHIQHGFLKVRVDIYPSSTDKTYPIHYVDKPDRPYTEEELENEELQALVPTHKELNPCLCHFIKIDPETTRGELEARVREILDADTLKQLDNILSKPTIRQEGLKELMKPKSGGGRILPYTTDAKKLKRAIDKRFAEMEIGV